MIQQVTSATHQQPVTTGWVVLTPARTILGWWRGAFPAKDECAASWDEAEGVGAITPSYCSIVQPFNVGNEGREARCKAAGQEHAGARGFTHWSSQGQCLQGGEDFKCGHTPVCGYPNTDGEGASSKSATTGCYVHVLCCFDNSVMHAAM